MAHVWNAELSSGSDDVGCLIDFKLENVNTQQCGDCDIGLNVLVGAFPAR